MNQDEGWIDKPRQGIRTLEEFKALDCTEETLKVSGKPPVAYQWASPSEFMKCVWIGHHDQVCKKAKAMGIPRPRSIVSGLYGVVGHSSPVRFFLVGDYLNLLEWSQMADAIDCMRISGALIEIVTFAD